MANPPKINSASPKSDQNKPSESLATTQQEQKLNSAVWALLGTGAVLLDLIQIPLAALVIVNLIIDIFVGLSLGTFFLIKGMLNWKTGISIFGGFAVDFITDGIAPAWILDIGAVWLFTDGSAQLGKIPFFGGQIEQAATIALQKGKGGVAQTAEKEVSGAGASAKSSVAGKSVDGIKHGSTDETQKTASTKDTGLETTPKQNNEPSGFEADRRQQTPDDSRKGGDKSSVKFGDNFWKEYGETRNRHARMTAIDNASKQFGINKEEAERLAGKDWGNN